MIRTKLIVAINGTNILPILLMTAASYNYSNRGILYMCAIRVYASYIYAHAQ